MLDKNIVFGFLVLIVIIPPIQIAVASLDTCRNDTNGVNLFSYPHLLDKCGGFQQIQLQPAPKSLQETCGNGQDDDGDGLIDSRDPECALTVQTDGEGVTTNKPIKIREIICPTGPISQQFVSEGKYYYECFGTINNDAMRGSDRDEQVEGRSGNDLMYGGGGTDRMSGGFGMDTIYGSQGNDIIFDDDNGDRLYGEAGNDELAVDGADGRSHGVYLNGGAGDDRITGTHGSQKMDGGEGNDLMAGSNGRDEILGGDGDDIILSNFGPLNRIEAEMNPYVTLPDHSKDKIDCGPGNDIAWVNFAEDHDVVINCETVHDERENTKKIPGRISEVCGNGKDDDGDGKTDINDPECAVRDE
jgi:Ca2+-binding RTX toxin-like protein